MSKDKKVDPVEDLFEDDSTIPESNWFEFSKIGDVITGELVEAFDKEGKFGTQRVYVVRIKDGREYNVGLKHTTHKVQIQQLKRAEPGDMIGFRFDKEVDTGKVNPAKSISVRIRHVDKKTETSA